MEASETEGNFVETGYIYSVHGLQGEVRVKATTDFPELRFSEVKTIRNLIVGLNSCFGLPCYILCMKSLLIQPGRRWLRQQVSGREMVQEIELVEGRGHPGQKSWILRFHEINTVEQVMSV